MGCYHGHADQFLVQAGSGVITLGLADSPGVPPTTAAATLTASYNDLEQVCWLVSPPVLAVFLCHTLLFDIYVARFVPTLLLFLPLSLLLRHCTSL